MAKGMREILGVTPSTASTKDSVLVMIDAQNEYAVGHLKTDNVASTRKVIASLLEKYRKAGGSVVHIVHQVPDAAPIFTPNTDLAKEFAELEPEGAEPVLGKEHPGSFTGTGLEKYIRSTGKNKVVLTGYMAHVCVSTTARQADEKGFDVVIVEDAVGDRDIPGASAQDVVRIVLAELADGFGSVVKSNDIN